MLELLFSPKKAEHHLFEVLVISFLYCSLSIAFAVWVFPEFSSVAMVFLTVFSMLYMVQRAIKIEEEKELSYKSEKWLLQEHTKLVSMILVMFIGITIAFGIWSFFISPEKSTMIFEMQTSTIDGIRNVVAPTGAFTGGDLMSKIIMNNLKVLAISLVFAVFYGAGAIYVLVWNASVMGVVIGNLAKSTFGLIALPISFTKYFLHGIPEMTAYIIAAVAGGLIYSAVWNGGFKIHGKSKKLFTDALILITISVGVLLASAVIEVYISSLI